MARCSGALEPQNNSGIVATSRSPRLSQLLIKDVGGPSPGTQCACPLIKPQTRSDSGPARGGDEFISWPFRRPDGRGLGQKMGQQEVMLVGPLQRPPPRGDDDSILSPPGGARPARGASGLLAESRILEAPMRVNRMLAVPRRAWLCLQLGWGFLKNQRCLLQNPCFMASLQFFPLG